MHFDAVVIGADPAGSMCARELACRGLKVAVLGKNILPRDKVYGGFVSAKVLELLPPGVVRQLAGEDVCRVRLCSVDNDEQVSVTYRGSLGRTVSRKEFDGLLASEAAHAGAVIYDGWLVKGVDSSENGFTIRSKAGQLNARWLIGEDGMHSKTAAPLGRRPCRYQCGYTVSSELFPGSNTDLQSDQIELVCTDVPFSLGWVFPFKDRLRIGVGGSALFGERLLKRHSDIRALVVQTLGERVLGTSTKVRFLPAGGFRREIARGRVLLVGDAAGFVNPLTGEGIYYAAKSGLLAAEAIASSLCEKSLRNFEIRHDIEGRMSN